MTPELIGMIMWAALMLGWLAFVIIFVFREKPAVAEERKRDSSSFAGIALQGLAYAIVWTIRRHFFTPFIPANLIALVLIAIIQIALIVFSIWLVTTAIKVLGRQWSFAARLVEEHALVTEGPYQIVRHPIYTGMFGMLVATALAVSHWIALPIAIAVFLIGTSIRVRSEEKLLREAFGQAYEEYAKRVSAVLPFV